MVFCYGSVSTLTQLGHTSIVFWRLLQLPLGPSPFPLAGVSPKTSHTSNFILVSTFQWAKNKHSLLEIRIQPKYTFVNRIVSSQNPYVEALILNVSVFGGGVLRRWLKLNEVIRVGPWSDRIGVLIRRDTTELTFSAGIEGRPCGDTGEVSDLQARKRALTRNQIYPCLDLNCKKINFWCLKHPFCSILLWQPQQTYTTPFLLKTIPQGEKKEKVLHKLHLVVLQFMYPFCGFEEGNSS